MGKARAATARQQGKQLHKIVSERTEALQGLENVNKQVALYEASWTSYVDQLLELFEAQVLERDKQLGKLQEAGRAWSAQLRDASALLKQAAATDVADGLSSAALVGADDADMEAEVSKAEAVVQEQQARHAVTTAKHQRLIAALRAARDDPAPRERDGSRTPRRQRKSEDSPEPKEKEEDPGRSLLAPRREARPHAPTIRTSLRISSLFDRPVAEPFGTPHLAHPAA